MLDRLVDSQDERGGPRCGSFENQSLKCRADCSGRVKLRADQEALRNLHYRQSQYPQLYRARPMTALIGHAGAGGRLPRIRPELS